MAKHTSQVTRRGSRGLTLGYWRSRHKGDSAVNVISGIRS